MRKIFVSGSTGAIGAHLVKMLSNKGHTVHALVRSLKAGRQLNFPNVIFFKGDITNESAVDNAMKGCDQAYHLAANGNVWEKNSETFYNINVLGTDIILQSAEKHGVSRIVVTSTASVQGPSIKSSITETKERDVDFFNEYEETKSISQDHIRMFQEKNTLDIILVSPTRVYGPYIFGKPRSVTLMVDAYINRGWKIYPGTGKEIGNYVYIEDVAKGHMLAMEKGVPGQNYILAGHNMDYRTFYDFVGEISGINRRMYRVPKWIQMNYARIQLLKANLFGIKPLIVPKWISRANYNWEVSTRKAIEEIGLPITPFDKGMERTIEYVKSYNKKDV